MARTGSIASARSTTESASLEGGGPEIALWRAVIHRTLMDACGFIGGEGKDWRTRLRMQDEARRFLTRNSPEFRDICYAADIDPDWCREECTAIIAQTDAGDKIPKRQAAGRRGGRPPNKELIDVLVEPETEGETL